MGTWISHLRIAERVYAGLPGLDEAAFCVGNLAPDSGIPNADWSEFDPPKQITHFLNAGEGEGRIRDLEFYRRYLAPQPADDVTRHSFLLGYFCHLLSDNLWSRRIGSATKRDFAALFVADRAAAWELVKADWYGLDQLYVRAHADSAFWRVLMRTPNPPQHVPFIPIAGLHLQLDYIRKFYSQPDPGWQLARSFPYLSAATMARYVDETADDVLAIWRRRDELDVLAHADSALALLPAERLAAYPPPLGEPSG